jgi:tetratricopeptide (TPR) repeat protein
MTTPHFLSRFTPSLMPPEALEAIFVQREPLSREILERIRQGILSHSGRHTLLIGPRGVGKTHFISLLYYRIRAMEDLNGRVLIAWLREEEWGITSFRDFLFRILRSLTEQVPNPSSLEMQIASMCRLPPEHAELEAARTLKALTDGRALLLLAENLDDLFQRLGSAGMIRFREFMAENRSFLMVGSSPVSLASFVAPGAPFHGFFQVQQLQDLSFDEAIELIRKIASYEGNESLAAFMNTTRGRARLRALRYLAGGNHRAYVIFSQLLAQDSLRDLVLPLMRTIDDLTPYYQSRMALLKPEQRKIIEYACEMRHPVSAAEVARDNFLSLAVVNAQLDGLRQSGYLNLLKVQRDQFYELREPLMRLTIEVKKHRGKPIRLLLDFLRLWYSPSELKQRLSVLPPGSGLEREYAIPALELSDEEFKDPRIPECCNLYNAALEVNDIAGALRFAEELAAIRGSGADLAAYASCLLQMDRYEEAAQQYGRMVEQDPENPEAWRLRGLSLVRLSRFEESLASYDKAVALKPASALAWCNRGSVLLSLGRAEEALASCDRAIQASPDYMPPWIAKGQAQADLGRFEEAAGSFSSAIALDPGNVLAHVHLSAALLELKRFDAALVEAKTAVALDEQEPAAWIMEGFALASLNRNSEALRSLERAIAIGERSSLVHFRCAQLLFALDRWREGAAVLDDALSQFASSDPPDAGDTTAFVRSLMAKLYGPKILQLCIEILVLTYRKHRSLSPLCRGLIECIPDIYSSSAHSDSAARLWLESWKAVAGSLPEFQLPLRLLDFAVRYRENRDLRMFMEMAQEERVLLEPLLGLRVQESA